MNPFPSVKSVVKSLLCALCILCGGSVLADTISLKITVTGTPANNDTFVINSTTRTWKTSVLDASSQLTIGGSVGVNATNIYNHARTHGFNGLIVTTSGSDSVLFVAGPGQALTFSKTGTWGTGVLTTNVDVPQYPLELPATATPAVTTGGRPNRAQFVTWLIEALNGYFTTNKLTTPYAGTTDGAILSNAIVKASVLDHLIVTNSYLGGISSTNGLIFQSSVESGRTNSYWLVADAFGWPTVHDKDGGAPLIAPEDINGLVTLQFVDANYPHLGNGAPPGVERNDWNAENHFYFIRVTNAFIQAGIFTGTNTNSFFYGTIGIVKNGVITNSILTNITAGGSAWLTNSMVTNSTVHATNGVLSGVTLNAAQVNATSGLLNGLSETNMSRFNSGSTNEAATNMVHYLKTDFVGDVAFQRFDLSTLNNGVNADIDCQTNSFAYIGTGPTADFSIEGVIHPRNGRWLTIFNDTIYNMTIACEGGAIGNDPVPANRILTCTGADIVTVGRGSVTLEYQSALQRWLVVSFLP